MNIKSNAIRIPLNASIQELLDLFRAQESPVAVVFSIPAEEITRSNGMMRVESKIVTPADIGRIIGVALDLPKRDGFVRIIASQPGFSLDDCALSLPPIGFPGHQLECSVSFADISSEFISQIKLFAQGSGCEIASWSVEIAD